jgi:predicted GIY-YIG superfamily endonuclease
MSDRTAVYRFYDADGQLLYVGMTGNLGRRFAMHAATKKWWPQVARRTAEWFGDRGEAAQAEREAIRAEKPVHNIRLALSAEKELMLERAVAMKAFARERAVTAWELVRRAREGGVPDTILCARTEISRSTLNRVLGPRKADEQEVNLCHAQVDMTCTAD